MGKYMSEQLQSNTDRAEVWEQRSHMYQQRQPEPAMELEQQSKCRKVPVVYYLCRNRMLKHPHFIEVPLVSPDGLYLRDVIEKLNALRGRGMASLYSWSCKRSYKNAFVWNDLCEDDLIFPAHENEYVLKGTELVEENNSGRFAPAGNIKLQNLKQLPEPPSSITQDDCSSSTSMSGKETKHSHDDELSPHVQHSRSSSVSPESRGGKPAVRGGSLSLTKYKIYKTRGLADASTQTEEYVEVKEAQKTCPRSLSLDSGVVESLANDSPQNQAPCLKDICDIQRDSSPPSSFSACSSAGKTDTVESLIKADVNKLNNSERFEEEKEYQIPTNTRLRASNMLLQLISCGSISAQDYNSSRILSYRQRSLDSKFTSRLNSSSVMLGELDCLPENPRFMGIRLEDNKYFSGSLVETKLLKEEGIGSLKRSSSYSANRINKCESTLTPTKCIPRSMKASLSKQPRSTSMRSSVFEGPRISSQGGPNSRILSPCLSNSGSKRITVACSAKKQSKSMESFREDKENVIRIEERLASGARVIIHLKAPCDSNGNL